jgi:hypothetical protein
LTGGIPDGLTGAIPVPCSIPGGGVWWWGGDAECVGLPIVVAISFALEIASVHHAGDFPLRGGGSVVDTGAGEDWCNVI